MQSILNTKTNYKLLSIDYFIIVWYSAITCHNRAMLFAIIY